MGGARSGLVASSRRCSQEVLALALAALWSRLEPPTPRSPLASMAPSDHLQRPMNLILPLRRPNLVARAKMTSALVQATDEVLAGLSTVGTIHFARFDLVGDNLCMFSIYDGDFPSYIRDFVTSIGHVLEGMFRWVKDPPTLPVGSHVEEFIAWVAAHDAFQMPEEPTGLISRGLSTLPRDILVTLHRHRNVQLGIYRGYPGFSAAQVRHHLSVGW